jgi:hypothetical protein
MRRTDYIGSRGEYIASVRLTEVCRKDDFPYFVTRPLGDKCPTFDLLVKLVGAGHRTPFFFAQVKATRRGYTKWDAQPRLRVAVSSKDVRRMVLWPAPTYVVAVDEEQERAFIVGVYGKMREPITSVTTANELNCRTLKRLWDEVKAYWRERNMGHKHSCFTN